MNYACTGVPQHVQFGDDAFHAAIEFAITTHTIPPLQPPSNSRWLSSRPGIRQRESIRVKLGN